MEEYCLVGIDGNAYSIMGYTMRAMKREGLRDDVNKMLEEAKSGDYDHLLSVCQGYIEKCNDAHERRSE